MKCLSRPLPPDLTVSPKPIRKRTVLVALAIIAVILFSLVYYTMHNTFIVSVSIDDGKIITSDGRGPYKHQVDGVWIDYEYYFIIDVYGPRVIHVNFMDAHWKDTELRDVHSRLPSKDYSVSLMIWENSQIGNLSSGYIYPFKMDVGERFTLPKVQIQIFFTDPNTGTIIGIDTMHEKGGFWTQFQNTTWIPSTSAEPPQALRNESRIVLTKISEDEWMLDVNAWLVSYYGPNLYSGNMKDYVKLSLNLTINKRRAM